MKIKSISRFCFLFVLAAILNAGSANATILTSLSGTEAHITNNVFDAIGTEVQCGDGSSLVFNYVQRMVINGKVEMVLTEFINDVGTYELTLLGECGGKNLYGLGTCACRPTGSAAVNIETAPQEVSAFRPLLSSMRRLAWARSQTRLSSSGPISRPTEPAGRRGHSPVRSDVSVIVGCTAVPIDHPSSSFTGAAGRPAAASAACRRFAVL